MPAYVDNSPMIAEHSLQDCHNFNDIRKAHWPQDTPFHQKILGDLLDLRKTADFIRETKIAI